MQIWSIWDLDGCLSDDTARKHFVRGKHRDYDAYHQASLHDPPRLAEVTLMKAWKAASDMRRVMISTGRPEEYRVRTVEWLKKQDLWWAVDVIRYRPTGDTRPVEVIKEEHYHQLMDGYALTRRVAFAVDDRARVIRMWSRLGVPSLQSIVIEEASDGQG